jgi:hypothetical protein
MQVQQQSSGSSRQVQQQSSGSSRQVQQQRSGSSRKVQHQNSGSAAEVRLQHDRFMFSSRAQVPADRFSSRAQVPADRFSTRAQVQQQRSGSSMTGSTAELSFQQTGSAAQLQAPSDSRTSRTVLRFNAATQQQISSSRSPADSCSSIRQPSQQPTRLHGDGSYLMMCRHVRSFVSCAICCSPAAARLALQPGSTPAEPEDGSPQLSVLMTCWKGR